MRHYIRENRSTGMPRNLLFLDSETHKQKIGGEDRDVAYMCWTCYIQRSAHQKGGVQEVWKFWEDTDVMWNYIQCLARPKSPLYIVASNVTFDLIATGGVDILTDRSWIMGFYHQSGRHLILKIAKEKRSIVFLNLQNFYPLSIKQLGNLLGCEKGEVDFEEDSFESIKEYCRRDVQILRNAVLAWLKFVKEEDMGRFGYTYASQAYNAFRHRFMSDKILPLGDSAEDHFCRRGYFGGRVECFWIGEDKEEDFYMVDVNSMYPYVMRDNLYPAVLCGEAVNVHPERLADLLADYCIVADVKVWADQPVYPVRREGKMIFPTGFLDVVLGSEALRYAIDHGELLECRKALFFHPAKLFTRWVDVMYAQKEKAKTAGDKLRMVIYKRLLNSLYGKFGQTSPNVITEEFTEDSGFYSEEVFFDDHYEKGTETVMFHKKVVTRGRKASVKSNVAIALHVTEYARFVLWEYIQKAGMKNVFYCDTDSLIVNDQGYKNLQTRINRTKLGELSLERRGDRLTINAPKDYKLGSYKRQKGIRSDAEEVSPGVFRQIFFPGFKTLLREGIASGFPIREVTKVLKYTPDKGVLGEDGRVTPYEFPLVSPSPQLPGL